MELGFAALTQNLLLVIAWVACGRSATSRAAVHSLSNGSRIKTPCCSWACGSRSTTRILIPSNSRELETRLVARAFICLPENGPTRLECSQRWASPCPTPLTRVVLWKALPFEPQVPNEETIAAMLAARLNVVESMTVPKRLKVLGMQG